MICDPHLPKGALFAHHAKTDFTTKMDSHTNALILHTCINLELEIMVRHWTFSDQFELMSRQFGFWSDKALGHNYDFWIDLNIRMMIQIKITLFRHYALYAFAYFKHCIIAIISSVYLNWGLFFRPSYVFVCTVDAVGGQNNSPNWLGIAAISTLLDSNFMYVIV